MPIAEENHNLAAGIGPFVTSFPATSRHSMTAAHPYERIERRRQRAISAAIAGRHES
jgi:hypothetical protein